MPTCFWTWLYQITLPSSGTRKFMGSYILVSIVKKTVRLFQFCQSARCEMISPEILTSIFLLPNETEHLFKHLFSIPIFFFWEMFVHALFPIGLFVFVLLIYRRSCYIFWVLFSLSYVQPISSPSFWTHFMILFDK